MVVAELEGRVLVGDALVAELRLAVVDASPDAVGICAAVAQLAQALVHVVDFVAPDVQTHSGHFGNAVDVDIGINNHLRKLFKPPISDRWGSKFV